jgi:hypothetical protein
MRTFSNFERHAMIILANQDVRLSSKYTLESVVRSLFLGVSVEFDINKIIDEVIVTFKTKNDEKALYEIIDQLISIMVLFQYLESIYLIKIHNTYILNGLPIKIAENESDKKFTFSQTINDSKINEFFCDNWLNTIYVTEAFREFVLKDHFKSKDLIQHEEVLANANKQVLEAKKQTRSSKWTLFVSVLVLATTVFQPSEIYAFVISLINKVFCF